MDIFQIEASTLNLNRTSDIVNTVVDDDDDNTSDPLPEVSFDRGPEFNLNFFDNRDDSNTQGGYSNPGSVESTVDSFSSPSQPNSTSSTASTPLTQFTSNAIDSIDLALRSGSATGQNALVCGEFLVCPFLLSSRHINFRDKSIRPILE